MTITIATHGGTSSGSGSLSPAYPATVAGKVLLLTVVGKYPTDYPTLPANWTLIGVARCNANTGPSAGNGDVFIWAAYRISDGTESGTLAVTHQSGNTALGAISVITLDAGKVPLIDAGAGRQDTESTSISMTMDSDPGFLAGDLIVSLNGGNISTGAFATSGSGIAIPSITAGAPTELWDVNTTTGDDCKMQLMYKIAAGGPSSGVGVVTMTVGGVATAAAGLLIRVRQVDAPSHVGKGVFRGYFKGVQPW